MELVEPLLMSLHDRQRFTIRYNSLNEINVCEMFGQLMQVAAVLPTSPRASPVNIIVTPLLSCDRLRVCMRE